MVETKKGGIRPNGARRRRSLAATAFVFFFLAIPAWLAAAIPQAERDALIASFNISSGDSWTNNSGWKTPPLAADGFALPGTEGSWYGITVEADHVVAISLSDNHVASANFMDCLQGLAKLQRLDLSINWFTSSIPASFGSLTELQELDLRCDKLSGPIPAEFGNLVNLRKLTLSYNKFTGDIPSVIGNLANLEYLDLSFNEFSGSIPNWISSLPNLQTLKLRSNHIGGRIPVEALAKLKNIQTLDLTSCEFSGSVPSELGSMNSLKILGLGGNQFAGEFPKHLLSLPNLQELALWNNQFTGAIPPELGKVANLQALALFGNQFTGGIPPELTDLAELKILYLNNNLLEGPIPPELGKMKKLLALLLNNNKLSGSIPPELGNMTALKSLWLNFNRLTGPIPAELGNLNDLQTLDLSVNTLSGSIPGQIGNLVNLAELKLHRNKLSGSIPGQIGNLKLLREFRLDGNQFTGSLPPQFMDLTNLLDQASNLNYNALHTNDAALGSFLGQKTKYNWARTQTVAPTDIAVGSPAASSLTVTWTRIAYQEDEGGYRVFISQSPDGPFTQCGFADGKWMSSLTVSGLSPKTTYYFVIQTETSWHSYNNYTVVSEMSAPVSGTTWPDCFEPAISVPPANGTVCPGQPASLGVTATGTPPLHYNWYQGTAGDTGTPAPGATDSADYTTPALGAAASYWVQVSNACGRADSAAAMVAVLEPTTIRSQPTDTAVCSGSRATLSVAATGVNLSYQWYQGASGSTGSPMGAGGPIFTTPVLTMGRQFWCRVSGECGTADSLAAMVMVNKATAIKRQPAGTAVPPGGRATLRVIAEGESLTYQWYRGSSGDTAHPVEGATEARLDTPPLYERTRYWVQVRGDCGTADSKAATVLVSGDVNGDGQVDGEDLALLGQFLAEGLPVGTGFDSTAADLDEDGRVDTVDLTILSRVTAH